MRASEPIAVAAPAVGPAIITLFGQDVPVLALGLSVLGLLLARVIAPPPLRRLSRLQHAALTLLLLLILFLLVTGALTGSPMRPGMATMLGIGLGFSGLVAIEFFAERGLNAVRAFFGKGLDG